MSFGEEEKMGRQHLGPTYSRYVAVDLGDGMVPDTYQKWISRIDEWIEAGHDMNYINRRRRQKIIAERRRIHRRKRGY